MALASRERDGIGLRLFECIIFHVQLVINVVEKRSSAVDFNQELSRVF